MSRNDLKTLAVVACAVLCAPVAHAAGVPRLGAILYGQVRNEYGRPCLSTDGVVLAARTGGVELTSCDIGSWTAPGLNYQLQINVVAPGATVEEGCVEDGDSVNIAATVGTASQNLIGPPSIVVHGDASCTRQDFILGTDSDGDGLPDAWEQFMLAAIGPGSGITNITQITPNGDFDNDGASNREEFLAGTFAFLGTDVLRIEDWKKSVDGCFLIKFLTTSGIYYEVRTSPEISGPWQITKVGSSSQSPASDSTVHGSGDFMTIYFPTNVSEFIRVFTK